ncbi:MULTISPECIES: type II toxin-antitoxin system Phd/YefM family antitoxin [unclassified Tolypothrix]|uniref:type II toxin-antitoxin system Phd/YefM family antitoxin n=1 Tax=unclassified Tolypothrix TaxID=2649714 RepID=UPI0005EAA9AE|nr:MULTISPECIES: type II toxin-antitoxin system prevent-host-death family antitoxin [unclassified Tolypothrix]BAY90968.1 prevent-host-death family protein [Microchaete diplosiphon NIES-3275]EKE99784.1 prevent-host-death family protein [Tolypothrix sp. PCC 7601]MBE9082489.1 type II toxin-antitoxin system Phd/YefM family antitoxin [Tolypothrix sp. LEGE 11397]UYD25077.1 type II toxin-antitoxin system Phd/YefM family antitoxin [Tolypothrix sp. PCC 7712]UYD32685.1 type II toxin-antitoxin system Phd
MSQQYSIEEIPVNFNRIIEEVEQGEPIQITRQGQQVAVILSSAEYERLLNKSPRFWESVTKFRQEIIEEGIDINPDEVWQDVRDKSSGREVNL